MASTTTAKRRAAPAKTEIRKGRKSGAAVAPSARPRPPKVAAAGAAPPTPVLIPGTDVALVDPRLAALLEPIDRIVPDPTNPRRTKNLGALVRLFRRFGYSDPIVVSTATRTIEAGHQRHAALASIGATHVPVVWTQHGSLDAAGYNIGHNRSNEVVAEWDDEALRKLVSALKREDAEAVADLGWSDDELERLLGEFTVDEAPFPDLSTLSTKSDLKLRTFTLSQKQLAIVERALAEAQTRGALWNPDENNANGNGNALAAICGLFLGLDIRSTDVEGDGDG